MKCSDCKFFKTDECKLKPEAEFFVAENFACFELDSSSEASIGKQGAVPHMPTETGGKWGISIGGTLFIVGIVGIIIFILICVTGADISPEPEALPYFFVGGVGVIISLLILSIGAIWWFVDWLAERRYWKSFDAHDSNSDYNKAIKKP